MSFLHHPFFAFAVLILLIRTADGLAAAQPRGEQAGGELRAEWYFQDDPVVGRCRWPTHLFRDAEWEIITDLKGSRLIYRRAGGNSPWRVSPIVLNQSHSVERFPGGTFIVADTDNHRVVTFSDPAEPACRIFATLAGLPMERPHDTVLNPDDGYVYIIDSFRRLYRVDESGERQESWQFGEDVVGYARSLSFFDGAIHLINSADGEVLRIDSFERREFTRFRSFGKKQRAPAGAFERTGFVLNDVEKWGDWYYGTNYFCPSYAGDADSDVLRLVRWRTWADFEAGRWEDLSPLVPQLLVPYYVTVLGEDLFLAIFDHESESDRDTIVRLSVGE